MSINITNENANTTMTLTVSVPMVSVTELFQRGKTLTVPGTVLCELPVTINLFTGADSAPVSEEDVMDNLGCYAAYGVSKFLYNGGYGLTFYGITWKRVNGEFRLGRVEKLGQYFTPKVGKEDRGPQLVELYETRWDGEQQARGVVTRTFTGRDGQERNTDVKSSLGNQAKVNCDHAHGRVLRAVMRSIMEDMAQAESVVRTDVERVLLEKQERQAQRQAQHTTTEKPVAAAVAKNNGGRGKRRGQEAAFADNN